MRLAVHVATLAFLAIACLFVADMARIAWLEERRIKRERLRRP